MQFNKVSVTSHRSLRGDMMKIVELIENPEHGTSGISSAYQLVESSSSVGSEHGTSPGYFISFPSAREEKVKTRREETLGEKLHRLIRVHRDTLDELDE